MDIISTLHRFETIEEMTDWLSQSDSQFLRAYLFKEFDKVKYYDTADQWNDAVRICEALAIIGWGERMRVDATRSRRDQWRTTSFRTAKNDICYREANWLPRKAGRYICNRTDYHGPSNPDRERFDYVDTREEDIICTPVEDILWQRNYLVQMPIRFGHIMHTTSDAAWLIEDYMDQLTQVLEECLDPVPYAHVIEKLEINVSVGWAKNAYKLKLGRYHAKRKSYNASLHIERDIADLSETEQRIILTRAVREIIRAFIAKLKKRKIDFPNVQFEADVSEALDKFAAMKGRKQLNAQDIEFRNFLSDCTAGIKSFRKNRKDEPQDPA